MSTRSPLSWWRMLLAAVAAVALVAVAGWVLLAPDRLHDRLQIVLAPHPDDEFFAFPALEDAPGTYTIVVSLTRGENSGRCEDIGQYLQEAAGERAPDPLPEAGDPNSCAAARLDSWSAFLDAAGGVTREVRLGPGRLISEHDVEDPRLGGDATIWQGRDAARALLGLPDGALTEADAVAALEGLLALRGTALPDLPVGRVVVAGYWNDTPGAGVRIEEDCPTAADCPGDPDAGEYEHVDHRALTLAAPALAGVSGAPTWVTMPAAPPAAYLDRVGVGEDPDLRRRALDTESYGEYLALGPETDDGPERVGHLQRIYGWLATPRQWWEPGETTASAHGDGVLFAREQTYLVVEAP